METRQRVITLYSHGHTVPEICKRLREENCDITAQSLYNLLRKFREKRMIADSPRQRRLRKLNEEMRLLIEQELIKMMNLLRLTFDLCCRQDGLIYGVSVATIKRTRRKMG